MLTTIDKLVAAILIVGLVVAAALLGRGPDGVAGAARIIDGDTLEIGLRRLRLAGLDAPELDQACERAGTSYQCGEAARDALAALSRTGPVACQVAGQDRYGRGLARCEAGGVDLGAALVTRGLAVASGGYVAEERDARRRSAGLWAGRFERPSEWRSAHRR